MNYFTLPRARHVWAPARAAALAAVLAAAPVSLAAQQQQQAGADFTWRGRVGEGGWLRVRNMNGAMRVEAASGNEIEVVATKRVRRNGNPDDVRIETKKVGPGDRDVLICALWGENSSCDERGYHSRSEGRSRNTGDVSVDFVVRLPRATPVEVSTVNGAVRVGGATAAVHAATVNGEIDATSAGGPVTATTVNGDVNVRMGATGTEDLRYSTVNGSITVEVPGSLDAEVEMSTVNGRLSSDYPMTVEGRIDPRRLRATIGKGGRRIKFTTVNGSVSLVRRG